MTQTLLIVEDDQDIHLLLKELLEAEGFETRSAYSGTEALLLLQGQRVDLILLDLMLPGLNGEALIERIREVNELPIIVISAKSDIDAKVHVLRLGADDYVTKPFNTKEVLARIDVQLRKHDNARDPGDERLYWRELAVDRKRHQAYFRDTPLDLTHSELDILSYLLRDPEKVFSKAELYEAIWNGPYLGSDNTISVHVSNLRKKIATHTDAEYIRTVWGIGFMLTAE